MHCALTWGGKYSIVMISKIKGLHVHSYFSNSTSEIWDTSLVTCFFFLSFFSWFPGMYPQNVGMFL